MFTDFMKSAVDFIKLSPRYLFSVSVIAGFLIFTPSHLLTHIGLNEMATSYKPWLGLVLVISSTLWIVAVIISALKWLQRNYIKRKIQRDITERLNSLSEDEKQILRYYYAMDTRANTLRIDDGVVQGLVLDHIIYRSSPMGNMIEGFAHNISDYVWDYIHVNPHVLEGTTNTYRTDKRESIW